MLSKRSSFIVIFLVSIIVLCVFILNAKLQNQDSALPKTKKIEIVNIKNFDNFLPLHLPIEIEFKEPITGVDANQNFKITPNIKGVWRWKNAKTVQFSSEGDWPAGYKGVIESLNQPNQQQNSNRESTLLNVKMQNLTLLNSFQGDFNRLGSNEIRLCVEFNAKIEPNTLKSYLTITNKYQNKVEYKITNKEPDKKFEIIVISENVEEIHLYFEKGLIPVNGKPLGDKMSSSIFCSRSFEIKYTKTHFDKNEGVIKVFANRVEGGAFLQSNIRISPEIPFSIVNCWGGFEIRGNFNSNQDYIIKIDKSFSKFKNIGSEIKEIKVRFPDKPASIGFLSTGRIYGLHGKKDIEIKSVNADQVNINLYQIPQSNYNLVLQLDSWHQSLLQELLVSTTKKIPMSINQESKWSIPLQELEKNITPGFYELEVNVSKNKYFNDEYSRQLSIDRRIIITDIGVSCRKSSKGLFFWVNRLSDLTAIKNAEIKLFSSANALLLTSKTDEFGVANLKIQDNILRKISFVLVQDGNDATYLTFNGNIRSYDSVGSKYSSCNYQAFINTERKVFRPGEKIEIDVVIRNNIGETPPPFPLEICFLSTDQKSIFNKMIMPDADGCFHYSYAVSETLPGGKYSLQVLLADQTIIGDQIIEIASFLPQRLSGRVESLHQKIPINEPLNFEISCEYLSGLSAEGLQIENRILVSEMQDFAINNNLDYKIAFHQKKLYSEYFYLPRNVLDKDGKFKLNYVMSKLENTNAMYRVNLTTTIFDKGGREYQLSKEIEYLPQETFLGVKHIGTDADFSKFEVRCFNSNSEIVSINSEIDWSLVDKIPRWTLINRNSFYSYEYSEEERVALSGKANLVDGKGEIIFKSSPHTMQELLIVNDLGLKVNYNVSEVREQAPKNPFEIVFETVSNASAGEEVKLKMTVPFLGKALLCFETNEVLSYQIINCTQKINIVLLKIPEDALGSVHLSCTLIQSQIEIDEIKNYRASGVCKIPINHQDKQLRIETKIPTKVNSASEINLACQILDYENKPVPKARVLISVMDKGIKNINGVYSPNMFKFFYGEKTAVMEEFDFYQDIVYEKIKWLDPLQPGGGGGYDVRAERFVSFKDRIKLVRWQSEALIANELGEITCVIPGFAYQGKLDYQIWSLKDNRFGYANSEIQVSDEVVLEESFPKYLYTTDTIFVPIHFQNLDDTLQLIKFSTQVSSFLKIKNEEVLEFSLEPKAQKTILLECTANDEIGQCEIVLELKYQDKKIVRNIKLPILSRKSFVTNISEGLINDNEKHLVNVSDLVEKNGRKTELRVSSSPFEQLRGSVDYLISYPYGCGEQTISKLLPLVYSKTILNLSKQLSHQSELEYYLKEGIVKLQRYQDYGGGIRLWDNASSPDRFVSTYAGFLFYQLSKVGITIDKVALSSLVAFLKNEMRENSKFDIKTRCFLLYVLALHGEFLKVNIHETLLQKSTLDRSAACFLYMAALLSKIELPAWEEFSKSIEYYKLLDSGGFYGSHERDLAVELIMATDFDLKINSEDLALRILNKRDRNGHWGSSQASSWCNFALMKYLQKYETLEKPIWTCEVSDNDKNYQTNQENILEINNIFSDKITIQKTGNGALFYRLVEKGFAKSEDSIKEANGLHLKKEILSAKNFSIVDENKLEKSFAYIVKLSIKSTMDIENIVIQEFFPAGMEYTYIDPGSIKPEQTRNLLSLLSYDIKDDRMYLFPEKLNAETQYEWYYAIRAISIGDFFMPACKAEAMYNASVFGFSKSLNIKIR